MPAKAKSPLLLSLLERLYHLLSPNCSSFKFHYGFLQERHVEYSYITPVAQRAIPRWLRKRQVRQIQEGTNMYWISQSEPITAEQAQPMPEIALPMSDAALGELVGWGSVADAERLILETHISASRDQCQEENPNRDTTIRGRNMQALLADMTGSRAAYTSFEVPFGYPQYRR